MSSLAWKRIRLEMLVDELTLIKNYESDASALVSLDSWIECMDGNYSGIAEIEEYLQLKAELAG